MTAASVQISVTTVTAQGTHFITSSSAHKRLEITGPPLSQSLSEWSLPVRDSAYPQTANPVAVLPPCHQGWDCMTFYKNGLSKEASGQQR